MMIYNTTYPEKEIEKQINSAVGSPLKFFERIRMRGIGSERIHLLELSEDLQFVLSGAIESSNLEIRPKGILVHFKMHNKTFAWTAPFDTIRFFRNGQQYTIHSAENFVRFESAFNKRSELDNFIAKALRVYKRYQVQRGAHILQ